jgi:GntR family transcriptional regulator
MDFKVLNQKLPLWYQITQSLRAEIFARAPDAPTRLPTEAEIAEQYGVSIITVRQALKAIEDEGLISRHRRLGTFIVPQAIPRRSLMLLGTLETVFAQQASEESELLEKKRVPVPAALSEHFKGVAEVTMFRRLRRDKGVPVSYAVNYVLSEMGKRITEKQLRKQPMTKVLRDDLGVNIRRIEDTVEAQLASPELANILQIDLMSPVLFFTGVTYGDESKPVDVACIHYRGDLFKFSVGFDVDAKREKLAVK